MRAVPRIAKAWQVPGSKKIYATKAQVYYALAKQLVFEKYPPWLIRLHSLADIHAGLSASPPILTVAQANLRSEKAQKLFFIGGDSRFGEFDSQKWTAFVRRVAKFLMWVDARRSVEAKLAGIPVDDLEARFHEAERIGTEFMSAADHYRAELRRRGSK